MKYFLLIISILLCSILFGQQAEFVNFKTAKVDIGIHPKAKEVVGQVTYSFDILKSTDSLFIDAQNMKFSEVILNGVSIVSYRYDDKKLWILHSFQPSIDHVITLDYKAHPKKAMYFIDWDVTDSERSRRVDSTSTTFSAQKKQVWTQGQGKYTSNWLPSFDDMNEKVEFDLSVTFENGYEVIANGRLTNKQINESTSTWHYDMQQPMSSYLVALAIGKYNKKVETSKSGIPLDMYYYPEDSLKVEPTYRYTKQMFDFLEDEIGVPYPWQNYKQVPVKDFLYAGMENTSTTIFSETFVIDSMAFIDKNYVNVNAHELAHQWFGDLVTETSGTHHWLQEGFATYYALLAERDVFGADYYYWRLYEYAQELLLQDQAEQGTDLLNPKASSTTFYKRGAWALHMLRDQIGDDAFKRAVKNYLEIHQFKNVVTNDFISEVEQASGQDLNEFVKIWLENEIFPYKEALNSLKKSTYIQEYLMVDCELNTSKCESYLTFDISDEAKIKIINQVPGKISPRVFNNSLKVRQAIAKNISKIPSDLKENYESLLQDKSYLTIEIALFNLWNSFPEDKTQYLQKTKGIQGFNDKSIKTLWLALALLTDDFEPENDNKYFEELTNYTNPEYGFEIRQNAFQYLIWIQACNEKCKENLNQATNHHNWRFSKLAKDMKDMLNKQ